MSNDNRGNFSDDDTNGVDRTVDPTIDFGDEFGVVKFAETDDSGPALALVRMTQNNFRIGPSRLLARFRVLQKLTISRLGA